MIRAGVLCLLTLLAVVTMPAAATEPVRAFDSPAQRERYYTLLTQLRCLVCQNQTLASSNSDLAEDMRDEVYRLIVREDRSNAAAIEFLTDRYGDFILYRPPVQPSTWLLWFGPLLMLVAGSIVLARIIRQRSGDSGPDDPAGDGGEPALTPAEHARAERLLDGTGEEDFQ